MAVGKWKLIYVITQIEERFVWQVVHKNGVIETGIGKFMEGKEDKIEAKWNFHDGQMNAPIRSAKGKIDINKNYIEWDDTDNFKRII